MRKKKNNNGYPFGSSKTNAYLTPKERLVQHITDPKVVLKGKHAPWEAHINSMMGRANILNDDEYNMWKKGDY